MNSAAIFHSRLQSLPTERSRGSAGYHCADRQAGSPSAESGRRPDIRCLSAETDWKSIFRLTHNRASVIGLRRFGQCRTFFSIVDYEGVIFSNDRPWPAWHVLKIDKLPVGHVSFLQSKVIAHGGRDIQASTFIQVGFWPFVAKNVLPVIGTERAGVFPLRI